MMLAASSTPGKAASRRRWPPSEGARSTRCTTWPRSAAIDAAFIPHGPPPMTRTERGFVVFGKVRHVAFARSQKLVVSAPGDAGFEEVPCMFVEVGENAPVRRRHFVCIRPGQAVDGERCDWVGTGISGSGQVVHVFELEIKDAAS